MDLLIVALVILVVVIGFILYYFLGSFAFGAGFEPTSRATVRSMLRLAQVGPSDTLVDLGAGTGAIVFRAARECGSRAIAVEREPLRYLILRVRRRWLGLADQVTVLRKDLFTTLPRSATVVALFLWPSAIERLRPRLERELSPGTRVVSHYHPVVGWNAVAEDQGRSVFLYRVPNSYPVRATTGGT
jgi:hypothetical protein